MFMYVLKQIFCYDKIFSTDLIFKIKYDIVFLLLKKGMSL